MTDSDCNCAPGGEPGATRLSTDQRDAERFDVLVRTLANVSADRGLSKIQALINTFSELIERGFWRPGDRLPTEKELSQKLSLSVGTVQAAMRALQSANLVERSRRSGTFVSQTREQGATTWYFRFRTQDGSGLLPWETAELYLEEIWHEGEWSRFLGLCPSYVKISRVVAVAGEFRIWSDFYLDGQRFRPLLDTPAALLAGKNLRVYLHQRFNAPTFRAVNRVSSCTIDEERAERLGCSARSAGIRLKAMSYTFRDAPISYHDIVIPANPYELEIAS